MHENFVEGYIVIQIISAFSIDGNVYSHTSVILCTIVPEARGREGGVHLRAVWV